MDAVIQLRSDVAALINEPGNDGPAQADLKKVKSDLDAVLDRWSLKMAPAHPARRDAELKRYFVLTGVPRQGSEDVLLTLRRLEAVTAAYSNPRLVRG